MVNRPCSQRIGKRKTINKYKRQVVINAIKKIDGEREEIRPEMGRSS